jgi:phosphopantothenoylcysteine synthetase/decarboxylase
MTTKNKVFDYIESMGGSMHYTEIVRYVYSLNHSPSEPYTYLNRGYYSSAFNIWKPRTYSSETVLTRYGHFVNPNCDRYLQKHESIRGLWVLINKSKTKNMKKSDNLLAVDIKFVKEMYAASNPQLRQKIVDKFPSLFAPKKYKIGTFFELFGGQTKNLTYNIYILAQVEASKVALISLDGNRFNDPIKVKKVDSITQIEFDLICGNDTEGQEDLDEYKNNDFRLVEIDLESINRNIIEE